MHAPCKLRNFGFVGPLGMLRDQAKASGRELFNKSIRGAGNGDSEHAS